MAQDHTEGVVVSIQTSPISQKEERLITAPSRVFSLIPLPPLTTALVKLAQVEIP